MPRLILLVLSVLAVAAAIVTPAGAATVSDCQAQIDQLAGEGKLDTSDAAALAAAADEAIACVAAIGV